MPEQSIQQTCMWREKSSSLLWFIGVPFIVLADQASKWWIIQNMRLGETIPLFPGVNFTLAHNYGVAFGMFNDNTAMSKFILLGFAMLITLFIGIWLYKTPRSQKLVCLALTFVLGGALGNILDRIQHGFVIDFNDCYYKNWHWWIFNLADAFITIGALFLIKSIIFDEKKEKKHETNR